jgi:hypothetical protein
MDKLNNNANARRPLMPYAPIEIDQKNLTIMGVNFSTVNNFDAAVNAIGTVMFEGFDPTPRSIEIIRDYLADNITLGQLIQLTKEKAYA